MESKRIWSRVGFYVLNLIYWKPMQKSLFNYQLHVRYQQWEWPRGPQEVGNQEGTKPMSMTQLRMVEAWIFQSLIETCCLRKVIRTESGGPFLLNLKTNVRCVGFAGHAMGSYSLLWCFSLSSDLIACRALHLRPSSRKCSRWAFGPHFRTLGFSCHDLQMWKIKRKQQWWQHTCMEIITHKWWSWQKNSRDNNSWLWQA